ncbi:MAG: hypothetical protein QF476_08100 [Dehalococcoidia bacterium]|nr:hypothetical protein [Dehalococcoidia bacterium]
MTLCSDTTTRPTEPSNDRPQFLLPQEEGHVEGMPATDIEYVVAQPVVLRLPPHDTRD